MKAQGFRSEFMIVVFAVAALAAPGRVDGQTLPASRDVCVSIDDARDNLSPEERLAAKLLVARQFDREGWHSVPEGCPATYTVSHVRLGNTITVTLAGPSGRREGTALGLDDLPALYSQMVRSLVTGQPMAGRGVVDRANVTEAQAQDPKRTASESFGYARLGGGVGGGAFGFGRRMEGKTIAMDVSFLNGQQLSGGSGPYGGGSSSVTWVKLEGLRFTNQLSNDSAYYGGGFSWGTSYRSDGGTYQSPYQSWSGSGLQAELTAGYEFGRTSTMRMFVQVDATLPLYRLTSYSLPGSRYSSAFVASFGLGWNSKKR